MMNHSGFPPDQGGERADPYRDALEEDQQSEGDYAVSSRIPCAKCERTGVALFISKVPGVGPLCKVCSDAQAWP